MVLQMNKLHISDAALNDLDEIQDYIESELENAEAALHAVSEITKRLRILQNHAEAGPSLSSIADAVSNYRFLVCGNYIAFYRAEKADVYVDRILYGRRDYLRILFGESIDG